MQTTLHRSPETFWAQSADLLTSDEAVNGLPLGIVLYARRYPPRVRDIHLWTVADADDALQLVAIQTPPRELLLAATDNMSDDALDSLIAALLADGRPVPGVGARRALAQRFAARWAAATGRPVRLTIAQRIHRLDAVQPVDGVAGAIRAATPADCDLLATWFDAFDREALAGTPDLATAREFVSAAIERGEFYDWQVDGAAVAMAKSARPLLNGITISAVYTPPMLRGRGYASACVAALSKHLLAAGWQFCTLFTDLANPTSNKIYARIGYRPVADWDRILFD